VNVQQLQSVLQSF